MRLSKVVLPKTLVNGISNHSLRLDEKLLITIWNKIFKLLKSWALIVFIIKHLDKF